MKIRQLPDPYSHACSYLVWDTQTRDAALIDPVLNQAGRDVRLIRELGLKLRYTLETSVHTDHVTGSGLLRKRLDSIVLLHENSGSKCADVLLRDADRIPLGNARIGVMHTPGHAPCAVVYRLPGIVFTGDTLLIRDCARTDCRSGDPGRLYDSVKQRLFSLPDNTIVYPGHDYSDRPFSTIGEEKACNPRFGIGSTRDEFITAMNRRLTDQPQHHHRMLFSNLRCGLSDSDFMLASG